MVFEIVRPPPRRPIGLDASRAKLTVKRGNRDPKDFGRFASGVYAGER